MYYFWCNNIHSTWLIVTCLKYVKVVLVLWAVEYLNEGKQMLLKLGIKLHSCQSKICFGPSKDTLFQVANHCVIDQM